MLGRKMPIQQSKQILMRTIVPQEHLNWRGSCGRDAQSTLTSMKSGPTSTQETSKCTPYPLHSRDVSLLHLLTQGMARLLQTQLTNRAKSLKPLTGVSSTEPSESGLALAVPAASGRHRVNAARSAVTDRLTALVEAPVQAAEVEAHHGLFLNGSFQGAICYFSLSECHSTVTEHGLDVLTTLQVGLGLKCNS